jgi:hypothetical protein
MSMEEVITPALASADARWDRADEAERLANARLEEGQVPRALDRDDIVLEASLELSAQLFEAARTVENVHQRQRVCLV